MSVCLDRFIFGQEICGSELYSHFMETLYNNIQSGFLSLYFLLHFDGIRMLKPEVVDNCKWLDWIVDITLPSFQNGS